MSVRLQFESVETGGTHAFGRIGVVLDDALDVPVLELLRKGTVGSLLMVRGGYDRQPVTLVPTRTPTAVGQLEPDHGAVFVAGAGEFLHPANRLVLVHEDVVENRRTVTRDRRRPCSHRQGNTGLRPLPGIGGAGGLPARSR